MVVLPRKEQETVVLTFERDYGKLLRQYNSGLEKQLLIQNANNLAKQINRLANPNYFEDDMLEVLYEISSSINKVAGA